MKVATATTEDSQNISFFLNIRLAWPERTCHSWSITRGRSFARMNVWKRLLTVLLLGETLALSQVPATKAAGASPQATALTRGGHAGLGAITATDERIAVLQNQVKESPDDYSRYDHLGAAYFQKARETGDIAYYELAEKTLNRSVALMPRNPTTVDPLVDLALVYMGEHRFTDALISTQQAIAAGTGNLVAFATEGDAYIDIGEYEQAAAAYDTLRTLGGAIASPLTLAYMADSRLSYLKFLSGETAESIRLMNQATVAALQLNIPKENLAWLYYEWGQRYFQAGDLQHADMAYSSALAADPGHYRSLAGLAQVRAAQEKLDDSIKLYKASVAIVPLPQYIADLGDIYLKTGQNREAQEQYDLVEYIGHLGKLNQVLHNRDLALFYADRGMKLTEAVQLARDELAVRQDIYTWDALAWVLFKNHQLPEAKQAIDKAQRLHTNDPILLFHAGMIEHALGNDAAAQDDLRRALAINPHFHIFYAQQAADTLAEVSHNQQMRSVNAAQ
jgi:tetratricopeptide (TPR) repeat protein